MRNPIQITLGGELRTLALDLNALIAVEEKTGQSLDALKVGSSMSVSMLRTMLWACLLSGHPGITPEEVGSWVTIENLPEVTTQLVACVGAGMPAPKKDSEGQPPARPLETTAPADPNSGTDSAPSDGSTSA